MAHRCVRKLRLAKPSFLDARHFHSTPAHYDALALHTEYPTAASTSSSSRESPLNALRQKKVADLQNLLALRTPSPSRVWGTYLQLLEYYDTSKVPLEIHQSVLRKCAPPASHVRALAAKRMAMGRRYGEDLLYESRYQRIIRNIRSAGDSPSLEDYHCVLELFAAVGNHNGAMMVLEEIGRVGLVKDPQTYSLCLQALCHRLTLPVWHLDRPKLVEEVTSHCMAILNEMASRGVPYIPLNVDLAFRILKETLDMSGFATLMKMAYGIDLEYPDRSPLEYWGKMRDAATETEGQDILPVRLPAQIPFTIAAFNTTLDYLARTGNVSKLVQTFEVITTPLPSTASNSNAFADEDDDDFGISNPQVAPYKPPHVQPNSTSYRMVLRGVCKAGHGVLARHYIRDFTSRERESNHQLRKMADTLPPDELPAPRLSIDRTILLPVFSLANYNKDMELLRWIIYMIKRAVRWHRADIEFFTMTRARWIEAGVYRPNRALDTDLDDNIGDDLPSAGPSSQFSTFFSPSSSSRQVSATFDPSSSDFDASATPPIEERKSFDVDLHLGLLERELEGLEELERRGATALERDTQRIKERLGRRVWKDKDIYLRDVGKRTIVSKETWHKIVNFRTQNETEGLSEEHMAKAPGRTPKKSGVQWSLIRDGWLGEQYRTRGPEDRDPPPHKSSRES